VRNIDDGTPIPGTYFANDRLLVQNRAEVVAWLKERNK